MVVFYFKYYIELRFVNLKPLKNFLEGLFLLLSKGGFCGN